MNAVSHVYLGESAVEIYTEADSNDITEYPHDDKPTTGMFVMLYSYMYFSVFDMFDAC